MRFSFVLLGALSLSTFGCAGTDPIDGGSGGSGGTTDTGGAGPGTGGGANSTGGSTSSGGSTPVEGNSENLFVSVLGKTQKQVDDKVKTAIDRFFGVGTGEPNTPTVNSGYRCYYELPTDSTMAFIWAADSNDIRSEGQSYGMMMAVQMDMQAEFDKLWKFAKTYSQYSATSNVTAWRHYFRWQNTDASDPANFNIQWGEDGPAPDGDEYFAAALYLADRRWGSSGSVDYKQEADAISGAMLHNPASADGRFPLIHQSQNMVVFYPHGGSNEHTDPSYHLPAFYELFAEDGPSQDSAEWTSIAQKSRSFLVSSAHDSTGLHPDYANFDGSPNSGGSNHQDFRYDAWRVVMNMALDYVWYSESSTMKAQVEKYHAFFADKITNDNVTNSLFAINGTNASGSGSTALVATLAAGALASTAESREDYVNALWNVQQQSGQYRYYQESIYLLGLLATAGKFNREF